MSGKTMTILKDNLWTNNPIFIQILGICSTLAVTNILRNTMIMTVGVSLTTAFSSVTLSAMKEAIPRKVRMIIQVLVISFYVIIIDILLRAYLPDVSKQLGPYVGLIITNCIIMGRAEAFAAGEQACAVLLGRPDERPGLHGGPRGHRRGAGDSGLRKPVRSSRHARGLRALDHHDHGAERLLPGGLRDVVGQDRAGLGGSPVGRRQGGSETRRRPRRKEET